MKHLLLAFALSCLGGCTVYAPMHCAAPNIREKGGLEVAAALNANCRVEGAVTYSPVKHLLVRAAGGFRNGFPGDNQQDTTFFRVRQYEVAAGGYWCPLPRLVVGALGGFGQAHNRRGFIDTDFSIFGPAQTVDERWRVYDARYHSFFSEGFAAFQWRYAGCGGALRLTDVQFDELTNRGQPVALRSMLRVEPMGFGRFNPTARAGGFLLLQAAAGLSFSPRNSNQEGVYVGNVRDVNLRIAVSLLFYPQQLWNK